MRSTLEIRRQDNPVRLNVGCGRSPKPREEGWTNCDLYAGPDVDSVFDAQKRWPFADASVEEVYSSHTLEHLVDYLAFFQEAYRVLRMGGKLTIRVPHGWHSASWWDFTHVRPWLQESFATVQPGFTHFTRNFQHERMRCAFWVRQATLILCPPWSRWWRWSPLRPLIAMAGRHLIGVYREIMAELEKTTEDDGRSAAFGGPINPCTVPCAFGAWEHEFYGKPDNGALGHRLMVFVDRDRMNSGDGT